MKTFNWIADDGRVLPFTYKWFAIDKNGAGYAYLDKPSIGSSTETWGLGQYALMVFVGHGFSSTNWKSSLQERTVIFNWSYDQEIPVESSYKWFAIDKNGQGYVFRIEPYLTSNHWDTDNASNYKYIAMFDNPDWKLSLIQRPVEINDLIICNSKDSNSIAIAIAVAIVDSAINKSYTTEQIQEYVTHTGSNFQVDLLVEFFANKDLELNNAKLVMIKNGYTFINNN